MRKYRIKVYDSVVWRFNERTQKYEYTTERYYMPQAKLTTFFGLIWWWEDILPERRALNDEHQAEMVIHSMKISDMKVINKSIKYINK